MIGDAEFFRRNEKRLLLLLLPLCYALFFHDLGNRDIWNPDEDEYVQVNIEMVRDGHWIKPTLFGEPYSIKPPLLNWIGSGFSVLAGGVSEHTSRLPSAIAATLGLFALYPLGRMLFGRRAAYLAVLVLATTPLYVEFGRWIQINMISTALLVATLTCFWWGWANPGRRSLAYLLMYAPAALGTLDMGAVNAVMPAIVIASYLIVMRSPRHILALRIVPGLILFLAITAPWYVAVGLEGGYAENLLITTNFTRFFTEWQHTRPFYYYLGTTPAYFLPWFLYLPGILYLILSGRARRDRERLLFPLVWLVSLFVFFSCSQTKRSEYVLPVFPALALLVGYGMDRALNGWDTDWPRRWLVAWPTRITLGVAALAGVGAPLVAAIFAREWLPILLPLSLVTLVGAWASHRLLESGRGVASIATLAITAAALVALGAGPYVSKRNEQESAKSFCREVARHLAPGERVKLFRYSKPVYGVYTGRFLDVASELDELREWMASDQPVFVIMKEKEYLAIEDELPQPLYVVIRHWIDRRYVLLVSNRPPPEPTPPLALAAAGGRGEPGAAAVLGTYPGPGGWGRARAALPSRSLPPGPEVP